jgi:uncharacterized membrane protein YheB (UPF0754 family)
MKEPTKKLQNLARRFTKVQKQYNEDVRAYVRTASLMHVDIFWKYLEVLAREFFNRRDIKSAIHNTMITIMQEKDFRVEAWATAARFVASYVHYSSKLHQACWDMPGVEKSDDSYGDWTDALPLAGRTIVEGIMAGDIATYTQVSRAIAKHPMHYAEFLHKRVQNGENYVQMNLEDALVKRFANSIYMDDDSDTEDC